MEQVLGRSYAVPLKVHGGKDKDTGRVVEVVYTEAIKVKIRTLLVSG